MERSMTFFKTSVIFIFLLGGVILFELAINWRNTTVFSKSIHIMKKHKVLGFR
jgi:hypothetical protein